jgi:molecular chaperone DnaK (HSP70)
MHGAAGRLKRVGVEDLAHAFGIDLGTTNSTLARVTAEVGHDGLPLAEEVEIAQPTPSGQHISALVPSMVAVVDGRVWVGKGARDLRSEAPAQGHKLVRYKNLFFDTKNEIGTSRTYSGDAGIESPVDVAARVLRFIGGQGIDGEDPSDVVVTVPASFQVAQRTDTVQACRKAGLNVDGQRLLDEPIAAFIDFAARYERDLLRLGGEPRRLLILDFGGGTCDVALFEVARSDAGLDMKSLSVSRYHRLGGGDIDLAILHRVLLPRLLEDNGLTPYDVDFDEVQAILVPALLPVAEALKIQLSNETARLKEFGQYENRKPGLHARYPAGTTVRSTRLGRNLQLAPERSTLSATELETLLEPFLSETVLAPRVFEGRIELSIFAPIDDALERAGLARGAIDFVFAVGGSSLIPAVLDALKTAFKGARHLTYPAREDFQFAVARGAALQAWSLATRGVGLIRVVAQDDIFLELEDGLLPLVARGEPLPFPQSGRACTDAIAVPEDASTRSLNVDMRIVAGQEGRRRLLAQAPLAVDGVTKGTPILVEYRFDENQVFEFKARLRDFEEGGRVEIQLANPVSNVVNPNALVEKRDRLLARLRADDDCWDEVLPEVAQISAELGHYGQALAYLRRYQRRLGRASSDWINMEAIYEEQRGNFAGARQLYESAAQLPERDGAPCFNLALLLDQQGQFDEALKWIDEAQRRDNDPAYETLALRIRQRAGATGIEDAARRNLRDYGPLAKLTDFDLGWYENGASLAGDEDARQAARAERSRRAKPSQAPEYKGVRPVRTRARA